VRGPAGLPVPVCVRHPPAHQGTAHHRWLRRALDPSTSAAAAAEVASLPARPARASQWADLLSCAAQHRPVLVHGDIHGDQMLADGGRLAGIIDWETARVDHPFWDFDVGQWGSGLWRRRRDFSALLRRAWRAYADRRGLDNDSGPLETAFRLRHALALIASPRDPAAVGTLRQHLASL
jgi:aminoglycoside phosphotransferase (APT) family kinase protein